MLAQITVTMCQNTIRKCHNEHVYVCAAVATALSSLVAAVATALSSLVAAVATAL